MLLRAPKIETCNLHERVEKRNEAYPIIVELKRQPNPEAVAWCRENFGEPANAFFRSSRSERRRRVRMMFRERLGMSHRYMADASWDVHFPRFHFKRKRDAAAFKMVWG
jgi:hypothetical protein